MAYLCEQCEESFQKLSQLLHHRRTENHWQKFMCPNCKKTFTRRDNLDRHMKKHRDENAHHCPECLKVFMRWEALEDHLQLQHEQIGAGRKRKSTDEDHGVIKQLKKDDDPRQFYTMKKIKSQRIEKFKTTATSYKISFQNIEVTENISSTLRRIFSSIFQQVSDGAKSDDLFRVTVQSQTLDYTIIIPFIKLQELTADRFMSEIERVLQSNEDFAIDTGLTLEVTHVDMPNGGTRKRCKFVNMDKFMEEKKCILRIQNQDDLCCSRAIVTAKARIDKHEKWNSIRQGRDIQRYLAEKLHTEAGVPPGKCGIEEVKIFQSFMPGYQLYIVSKEHFNAIIFKGPDAEKKIYLYYHDQHYDVITSMPAFVSRIYYCTQCDKGYDHKEEHKCNSVCYACRKVHTLVEKNWIECETCCRFFRGQECYDLHLKLSAKGNSTCSAIYRCITCGKTVNKKMDKKHVCGQIFCNTCKDFFPQPHKCNHINAI